MSASVLSSFHVPLPPFQLNHHPTHQHPQAPWASICSTPSRWATCGTARPALPTTSRRAGAAAARSPGRTCGWVVWLGDCMHVWVPETHTQPTHVTKSSLSQSLSPLPPSSIQPRAPPPPHHHRCSHPLNTQTASTAIVHLRGDHVRGPHRQRRGPPLGPRVPRAPHAGG